MKLIVVGVDGSPAADAAVREALELAGSTGASLLFVVAHARAVSYGEPFFAAAASAELAPAHAAADAALIAAADAGVTADAEILEGAPGEAILHAAELREADLIVVGSRGLGAISSAFVGSVSRWLLGHAHIPVLVVKERAPLGVV